MRRTIVGIAGAVIAALAAAVPAQAQTDAVTVLVTEGVGQVCGTADLRTLAERNAYGNLKPGAEGKQAWCIYPGTAAYEFDVNPGQTTHPQWWVGGRADGSKFQGLFAPGIGPGANGPYSLEILAGTTSAPKNVCIDSIEGPGCGVRLVGKLTPSVRNGFGAHAGSSHGEGVFNYESNSGDVTNSGTLGWEDSLATILPLSGEVTSGAGDGNQIVGYSSSRGVTGDAAAGNAGVSAPTTGFQTEGFIVQYAG